MKNSMFGQKRYALFFAVMIVISLMSCNATPTQQAFQAQNSPTNTATNTLPPPTETPSPTFTLVPTLTPSPTPIPQQSLTDIIASVSGAVNSKPVAEAMAYDRQKPGLHHIVLITNHGELDARTDQIPSEWLPKNVSEVELIAIINYEEVVMRVLKMFDPNRGVTHKIACVRRDIRVRLIEASSGKLIDDTTFLGADPSNCYLRNHLDPSDFYGESTSFDVIVQWLQGYVSP